MHTTQITNNTPATRNDAWGFWGTMRGHAATAWPLAIAAIAEATDESLDAARAFHDSREGRHFADDVNNGLHAGQTLDAAVESPTSRGMRWTISRDTSRKYGIPRGLPFLQGMVIHSGIAEDASAA